MVVTDHGKPVMALIGDPRFIALIERSRALYKPGTGVPLDEIRRKYGRPKPKKASRKRARKSRSSRP